MTNDSYVFWIFGWGVTPVLRVRRFSRAQMRCEIDRQHLVLLTKEKMLTVPLKQIVNAEIDPVAIGRYAGGHPNLRLDLAESPDGNTTISTTGKLWIVPVDVFANPPTGDFAEIETLLNVIHTFQANRQPSAHPNPYYRALQRRGKLQEFSEEKWSATTPPYIYTPVIHFGKFLLIMLSIVAGVTILGMTIVGLIFNLFFHH